MKMFPDNSLVQRISLGFRLIGLLGFAALLKRLPSGSREVYTRLRKQRPSLHQEKKKRFKNE